MRPLLSALAAVLFLALFASCAPDDGSDEAAPVDAVRGGSPGAGWIAQGEDGLAYLKGASVPYSGAVERRGKAGELYYSANYRSGKLHGPEVEYAAGGKVRRWFDWMEGEKVRHRVFYENGQIKRDAMFKGGQAVGPHRNWSESGRLTFDGAFAPGMLWHGRIRDCDDEGNVLWDAEFENGDYLHGVYPKSEEQNLIKSGLLDPETLQPTTGR